ncbi:MAG: hypothetical protein ACR2QW_15845 [bacterium]
MRFSNKPNALVFFIFIFALLMCSAIAESTEPYIDDTHQILESDIDIEVVSGDFDLDFYRYSEPANGQSLALDARDATFTLANSKNNYPTSTRRCDRGPLEDNRYPFRVYDSDLTWAVGGMFNGLIPQDTDWNPTYCNSAAVIFKDAACGTVDGIRVTSAWDGVRATSGSPQLTIKNNWISNVRDDAIENDNFLPMVLEDNLLDGVFHAISINSGGDITNQSNETIYLFGNLIRIQEYQFKGEMHFGSLFKNEDSSPTSEIHNSVIAVHYYGGKAFETYWERSWSKIEDCSNNLFLWLSNQPIPESMPLPPACFTVMTGYPAWIEWTKARQNWIDCHPTVARKSNEPASNPALCSANTFGGFSRINTDACQDYCHSDP